MGTENARKDSGSAPRLRRIIPSVGRDIVRIAARDSEIIDVLRVDGRASFKGIGSRIGMSTKATAARVRRLEKAGVIHTYRVVLAAETADLAEGLEAFIEVQPDLGLASLLHIRVSGTPTLDRHLRRLNNAGGATRTQTRLALR